MSATNFTVGERSALLRAAKKEVDWITDEMMRLHTIDGMEGQASFNRALADAHLEELSYLQSAIRKLWAASGEAR